MRIDLAFFTCPTCGHRSTPPEAVNGFAQQMEVYEKKPIPTERNPFGEIIALPMDTAKVLQRKQQIEQKHRGNTATTTREGSEEVTRLARSYSKVAFQDATELTESRHVRLACPECDTVLYEVYAPEMKAKINDAGEVEF
jgi:predicted RNA-binding Zn-ribbon protein involved in translation (DUF1610 family)